MARKAKGIPYDVTGVEAFEDGNFQLPPIGLYRAKIVSAVDENPPDKDRRLHVVFQLTHNAKGKTVKKENYSQLHRYYNLESEEAAGYLAQFLQAVGVVTKSKKTQKGTLDADALVGKSLMVRVKHEPYAVEKGGDGEPRAKAGSVMPLPADDEDEEPDEDDEDEDDEDEEADADDENEDEDEEDDEDEDDEDEDEDEEEDEDEDDEEEAEEPDWSEMSVKELEQAVKDNNGKVVSVVGRGAKAKKGAARKKVLVKWLEENVSSEDEDYSEWELSALKEELKNRDLQTKGSKAVLIKRLEKSDEEDEGSDPF